MYIVYNIYIEREIEVIDKERYSEKEENKDIENLVGKRGIVMSMFNSLNFSH